MPTNEERFNTGLIYVMDCLNLLMQDVLQKYSHLMTQHRAPFKITGDLINKASIKYNYNELIVWTKACKFFLSNLQWLVLMSSLRDQYEQNQITF